MQFGSKQLDIMRALWDLQRANAREITDRLNEQGINAAHSTVQTQLRLLMKKSAVGFEKQDRTFVFFPLVDRDDAAEEATRDIVDQVFGGSAAALVSHLLDHRDLAADELEEIRGLLSEHERKQEDAK